MAHVHFILFCLRHNEFCALSILFFFCSQSFLVVFFIPPLTWAEQSYRFCSMCILVSIRYCFYDVRHARNRILFSHVHICLFSNIFLVEIQPTQFGILMQAIDPIVGVTTFHQIRIFKLYFNKQNDILTWLSGIVW